MATSGGSNQPTFQRHFLSSSSGFWYQYHLACSWKRFYWIMLLQNLQDYNPNGLCHIQIPPHHAKIRHLNAVSVFMLCLSKICFNVVLWTFKFLRFPAQNVVYISYFLLDGTCPTHAILVLICLTSMCYSVDSF